MPKTTRELVEAMERFRHARIDSMSVGGAAGGAAVSPGAALAVVGP